MRPSFDVTVIPCYVPGLLCHVNVIPLNPTEGYAGRPTSKAGVLHFIQILVRAYRSSIRFPQIIFFDMYAEHPWLLTRLCLLIPLSTLQSQYGVPATPRIRRGTYSSYVAVVR